VVNVAAPRREALPPGLDPALYPFRSVFREEDGIRQHYVDEGPRGAPTVVMVHGNPTWSFYYRGLIQRLRPHFRVIVPDHVGCGLSDKPDDARYPYRLERRVRDLTRTLEHAGVTGPTSLVVHDWGGAIGMAWAVEHVPQLRRLVVLNTAAWPLLQGREVPAILELARSPGVGSLLVRGLNAFALGASYLAVKRPMPTAIRRAYLAPYDSWQNRIATLRFVEDIPVRDGDPGLDVLERTSRGLASLTHLPMLVAWGMKDFVFDADYLAEWARRFPEAEVHRFPDAGHYVLEDEADAIGGLVERFLAPEHRA
jgi:pimeloyl-ACP methyl ester carboxylesterase